MKKVFKCIYDFLNNTEVSDFFSCIAIVLKSATKEIYTLVTFIIKFPFMKFSEFLKPSDNFKNDNKIDFKKRPLVSTLKYLKHIFENNKAKIIEHKTKPPENLINFPLTRWIISIYLILVSIYWFYEIGVPNWNGPKDDFEQLMKHEALVNLTAIFAATMGFIAILHRSIVTDYQIRQQGNMEMMSNYYKVSEHIVKNSDKIILSNKRSRVIAGNNFPYGITEALFENAKDGKYEISSDIINTLNESSLALHLNIPKKTKKYSDIFDEIDDREGCASMLLSILHPIINRELRFSNKAVFKLLPVELIANLIKKISEKIEIESDYHISKHIKYDDIDINTDINDISNLLISYISIIKSIENLILTIPVKKESTEPFLEAAKQSIDKFNELNIYILELQKNVNYMKINDNFKSNEKTSSPMGIFSKINNEKMNNSYIIIYIYCRMILNIRTTLPIPYADMIFLENSHSISEDRKIKIKTYLEKSKT